VYAMTVASSVSSVAYDGDSAILTDGIVFDPSTRVVTWYWNFVPDPSTFTITIQAKITTDTNSQGALATTSPRSTAYLTHRLSGYQGT
jgi:hypothetical protein